MASAYELMLVLRGRNYLSNDLRRAGSDLRRLQTQGGLQSQRSQLQINAQRLANSRAIAQAELQSVTTGARRVALDKAITANTITQANNLQVVRRAEEAIERTEASRLRNAAQLSRLQRIVARGGAVRGFTPAETRQLRDAATTQDEVLASQQATARRQLEIAQKAQAAGLITTQQLTEREAELAHRQEILTDKINTTTAAEELNTQKLDENALAMKRLPLEQLGARAAYVEHLGRAFQTLGLFATAAVGAAAYAASKFQTGGVLAATQLTTAGNNSPQQIQRIGRNLNQQLLDFMASGRSVSSAQELQGAAYDIPSGIPSLRGDSLQKAKETVSLIKEFNQVAKANYGLVDLNGVTKAGIILINTFGTSLRNLPREFDVMQSAVNRGKVTLGEFVSGLSQTAPAARAAGYSFDAMSSVLSFLSGKLPQYTRVAVGYARALELFQNKKFEDYMKSKGQAITDLHGKLLPFNEVIERILKVSPALATGGNLINFLQQASGTKGTSQARRVITPALEDIAGLNRAVQAVPANAAGLVNKSAQALSQTGAVKWKELTTQIKAMVIEIGTGAIPAFEKLAKPIEGVVHWFNQLSPQTKKAIGDFAAWGAAGTLVGGTFLVVVGVIGRIYAAIKLFLLGRGGMLELEGGFIRVGTALRLGFIGAIGAAILLMIKYHTQTTHVVDALGGWKRILGNIATVVAGLKLASLISSIKLAGRESAIAAGETNAFRLSLLRLSRMGPIAVAIALSVIPPNKKGQTVLDNIGLGFLGKIPLIGGLDQQAADFGNKTRILIGRSDLSKTGGPTGSIANMQKVIRNLELSRPPGWRQRVNELEGIIASLGPQPNTSGNSNDPLHDILTRPLPRNIPRGGIGGGSSFNLNAAVANLEKLRAVAEKNPSYANWDAYEKALTALQKHYTGDQLTALNDYLNSIESTEKKSNSKRLTEAQKAARARIKAEKDAQNEIIKDAKTLQNQYQSLYQNNQSAFGSLFNGPFINSPLLQNEIQYGHRITGHDLLSDIKSQVSQFRQWRRLLGELRKRGITGDLYDQIVAAGPGSIDDVRALLSLSKTDLRSYARTFTSGENLIDLATRQDMNISLQRYRKYGRNIALQIVEGLRDEHTPVLKVFEDMITKDFPGLAKAASKHGKNSVKPTVTKKPPTRTVASARVIEQHTHYNVTAPTSEHSSIKTQLRHAAFINKSKYLKKPLP